MEMPIRFQSVKVFTSEMRKSEAKKDSLETKNASERDTKFNASLTSTGTNSTLINLARLDRRTKMWYNQLIKQSDEIVISRKTIIMAQPI